MTASRAPGADGTFEGNRGSIGRAIRRHPRVLRRAAHAVAGLPRRAKGLFAGGPGHSSVRSRPSALSPGGAGRPPMIRAMRDRGHPVSVAGMADALVGLCVDVVSQGFPPLLCPVVFLLAAIGMKAGRRRVASGTGSGRRGRPARADVPGYGKIFRWRKRGGLAGAGGLFLPVTRRHRRGFRVVAGPGRPDLVSRLSGD